MNDEYVSLPVWFLSFLRTMIIVILALVVIGWTYDRVANIVILKSQYITLGQAQQALQAQQQQYETKIKELQGGKK